MRLYIIEIVGIVLISIINIIVIIIVIEHPPTIIIIPNIPIKRVLASEHHIIYIHVTIIINVVISKAIPHSVYLLLLPM